MKAIVQAAGPGCHVWLRLPGSWGETNIGLVVGQDASLLIDTPWDMRLTRSMQDAFAQHTEGAPVRMIVNTHADPDHWWGNDQLPRAEVIASTQCAKAMRTETPPHRLVELRRAARIGARFPGRPGGAGRYVSAMLAPFEFGEVTLRFPDRTFTEHRSELVGGREVEFIDYGSAHTISDTVILVPDARVVYAGDLLFAGVTPVMWHGPVSGWLDALAGLLALPADVYVPGHGPLSTRTEVVALRDYWTWLATAVEHHAGAGEEPLEIARRLSRMPEFAAFGTWESPERLYINVATICRRREGKGPIPSDPLSRATAFDGVARLHRHLAAREAHPRHLCGGAGAV
jgi:glyoxylase-like metal-dependent hydrolase (beta-lactamase superfamily II)